jgi:hypothetical protein
LISFGRDLIIVSTPGEVAGHNDPKISVVVSGNNRLTIDEISVR